MMKESLIVKEKGRLDKILAKHLGCSRNQVSRLIDAGNVKVDDTVASKAGIQLSGGEVLEYEFIKASPREKLSVDFNVDILYEDDSLMVVNKPAGLVVHPAPSVRAATLVDWLIDYGVSLSTIYGEERHGIVHRIDKDTTGALVVAKNNEAHQRLGDQLKNKKMGRYYLALIDHPLKEHTSVDAPIARNPVNRLKMAVVDGGREARTDFLKLYEFENGTELIAARLHSGRTHQIRVHLASLGRHIIGDELYGYKSSKKKISRVFLHAYSVYFMHPAKEESVTVFAPLFDDMDKYIKNNIRLGVDHDRIIPENLSSDFLELFSAVERLCD